MIDVAGLEDLPSHLLSFNDAYAITADSLSISLDRQSPHLRAKLQETTVVTKVPAALSHA